MFGQLCHCAGHERLVGYQEKPPLPHSEIEERGYQPIKGVPGGSSSGYWVVIYR